MIQGFLHPALAWGALLASVPILIHLLNRQRFRPTAWGAMRFVEAAWRRTRRRMQLENLLLLLLRAGAIALLALGLARPFLESSSPLAALTETRRDLVVILDASASMGHRESVETSFDRARARAVELFDELSDERGDRAWLFLAGRSPRLLTWGDPSKAGAALDAVPGETAERMNLAGALAEVQTLAEEEAAGTGESAIEVHLLTDLQRNTFDATRAEDAAAAMEVLDALEELGVTVLVEDLGPPVMTPANLGITALTIPQRVPGPGASVEVRCEVTNHGDEPVAGMRLVLELDGERRPSRSIDLGARESVEVSLPISFSEAGDHTLEYRLEGDSLTVDDSRALVVRCPAPLRVALVNGAPASALEDDAIGLLSAALEPAGADSDLAQGAFRVSEVSPSELDSGELALTEVDVLWLANVDGLASPTWEAITDRVQAGAALIASLGDRVQPSRWNEAAFRPDGSGVLPAELGTKRSVASRREGYWRAMDSDFEHPSLSFFMEERWRPLWTEVPHYDFLTLSPLEDARVLARLDDIARSPLFIEREVDRGRVLLLATTIAPRWNRIAESPRTLIPFVHELVRYAGLRERAPAPIRPGEPFTARIDSFPRAPELLNPDGSRRPLTGAPVELGGGAWLLPEVPSSDTSRAGLYAITLEGAPNVPFAVTCEPAEGDLARWSPAELDASHPALSYYAPTGESDSDETVGDEARGELWRTLCALALAFLILESLWAARLGRRRGIA
ncbi:MAG: BatA domain-containing protein [Planctomycetes bacterium]|nr:BatA domain-containing protein [Planctomycetota bacterium]